MILATMRLGFVLIPGARVLWFALLFHFRSNRFDMWFSFRFHPLQIGTYSLPGSAIVRTSRKNQLKFVVF